MLILKEIDGHMIPIQNGFDDREGIYTIVEADYNSIVNLVNDAETAFMKKDWEGKE